MQNPYRWRVKRLCVFHQTKRLTLLITLLTFQGGCIRMQAPPSLPETRKDIVTETIHGVEIADPYRWLEDQESPETREWIEKQNAHTEALLDSLKGRKRIEKRLTELMRIDVVSPPRARNGRYFFTKRLADQDQPIIYVRKGRKGEDEVLVDPRWLSQDKTVNVNIRDVSDDGTILAYGIRQGGEDEVVIRFLNVDTHEHLADDLPKARYSDVSIKPDNSGVYYSVHTKDGPRVFYHVMGTVPGRDEQIFGKAYGGNKWIVTTLSEDGRHLLLHVEHSWSKADIFYKNVAEDGPIIPVVQDVDAQFFGIVGRDRVYIQTNWKAPKGRILAVDIRDLPQPPDQWREIIPARDAVIEEFSVAGGQLFLTYLDNVVSQLQVFDPDGKHVRDIAFPAMGEISRVSGRWKDDEAFFSYSSFHIPPTIYRYDIASGNRDVWAKLDVPIEGEDIEIKQVWYDSKDGTRIPMFLVYKKGLQLDGSNPTLLTGYGGFMASLTPGYSSMATIWVENGGVFARPNLRGGGEFGEEWHKAGMFKNKQNVFDDFIAAAEWLIREKYTTPARLAIMGGSNGGLLVGAALTQRPDLFKAVACAYPLLDMIRFHKFLLGPLWVGEYGSADDPEQFKYLRAYSPYHNVKAGTRYPAVLFITGDADTRVAPLHARKMAALLQSASGSDNPVLILYDTKTGHSGGMPIDKQIEDMTHWVTFLLWQLGVMGD